LITIFDDPPLSQIILSARQKSVSQYRHSHFT
jgi:hypothetical protein